MNRGRGRDFQMVSVNIGEFKEAPTQMFIIPDWLIWDFFFLLG